ncbi:MAG: flagellar biosynthesis protein FlhA [Alphaproteobacteria bacterium]|nr:flagellar biosynthesis protein FlhA [Alphaproteobacteria bacterium]
MAEPELATDATSISPDAINGESNAPLFGGLIKTLFRGDIALALGVVLILVILILPMPKWMLDFALAASITFSALILMTAMFIGKPLEFSSFPTVLLIATVSRLALNLASTRLTLSHGHEGTGAAGHVIEAFGNFVMGGNFVIGIIIFAILVLVNFVVITKGSGRIAEVAARFSLDAMPGKQMAIDADLSAGLIDEGEAKARRKELEDETTFFGSMDGAAKFVRGDAIAGLIITFINVVGGIIIGTAQEGLTLAEASKSYTLLTVGDGLVSQIPAIIVSVAAGMLVSKAGIVGSVDKAVLGQLGGYPTALGLVSFLMTGLAILPGIPMLPFLGLAGISGGMAWYLRKQEPEVVEDAPEQGVISDDDPEAAEAAISSALQMDEVRVELGYGLLPLVNSEAGAGLTQQIRGLRRQLANEVGFVMPSVRIQDNMQLEANSYVIRIKEIESARGELRPQMLLVMDPRGEAIDLPGEATTEPTFGLPAMWVGEDQREEATFRGCTVVEPSTVVTTHLTEVIKDNMADLLSYAEAQKLLDELAPEHKKLVEDIVPSQISVSTIQRVLKNLLRERVGIRDLSTILEGIAEACTFSQSPTMITEHVRTRLSRQISNIAAGDGGYVPLVTMSPEWEQAFADAIIGQGDEAQISMPPSKLQEFIAQVRETFDRFAMLGESPALLTSPAIRPFVRSIVERFRPPTTVMSQNEVHPRVKIKTLGQI